MIINNISEKTKSLRKRFVYEDILDYINSDEDNVLMLLGQRRVGKTTLLEQIQEEFEDSILVTIEDGDEIQDVKNFLLNVKEKIVLIDEISDLDGFIEKGAFLCDQMTKVKRKKVIITGTNSLSFLYAKQHSLYGRTVNIVVKPFCIREFLYIFNLRYNKDNYLRYTKMGGYLEELKLEDIIKYVALGFVESTEKYSRICSLTEILFNETKHIILMILLKIMWESDLKMDKIFPLVGISREDILAFSIQKIEELSEFKKTGSNFYAFKNIINILEDLGIIGVLKGVSRTKDRYIINSLVFFNFFYDILTEEYPELKNDSEFNKSFYGKMFEHVLVYTMIQTRSYHNYFYEDRDGEIDYIGVSKSREIILLEAKSGGSIYKKNKMFTSEFIEELKNYFNCKSHEFFYIYNGETNGNEINLGDWIELLNKTFKEDVKDDFLFDPLVWEDD